MRREKREREITALEAIKRTKKEIREGEKKRRREDAAESPSPPLC